MFAGGCPMRGRRFA